jgi:hypothetical protein
MPVIVKTFSNKLKSRIAYQQRAFTLAFASSSSSSELAAAAAFFAFSQAVSPLGPALLLLLVGESVLVATELLERDGVAGAE